MDKPTILHTPIHLTLGDSHMHTVKERLEAIASGIFRPSGIYTDLTTGDKLHYVGPIISLARENKPEFAEGKFDVIFIRERIVGNGVDLALCSYPEETFFQERVNINGILQRRFKPYSESSKE